MSLFEPLDQDTCEVIAGGNLLANNPSSAYPLGLTQGTNYGQYKKILESANNPSSWYPLSATNYGQSKFK